MIKTINENWLKEFNNELLGTDNVCIVSPFITDGIVKHLLDNFKGKTIKVITRYNLNEFRKGVSSLTAIERLLKANSQIKSVKGLHSKLYLFDKNSVIITSANFTNGGFFNNKEFGILSNEFKTVAESQDYFKELWNIDKGLLKIEKVNEWHDEIKKTKKEVKESDDLPDYGASYQNKIVGNRRYFVKFFGSDTHRAPLTNSVLAELKDGCSHFALSFSRPKNDARPIRYNDGDIVFLARITDTHDYAIFGRATTLSHDRVRDIANAEDIKQIPWLEDWPLLVRVKNPVYIDSNLSECPKLMYLISDLDHDCFESTQQRFNRGERKLNPKKTLMQKGDVILSKDGAQWMELAFQKVIEKEGNVDKKFVNSLYQSLKII